MLAEEKFLEVSVALNEVQLDKMFGAQCLKTVKGKAVAIFWKDSMLFKLNEESLAEALDLPNASQATHLYAVERPMTGWVNIPLTSSIHWHTLAVKAIENSK